LFVILSLGETIPLRDIVESRVWVKKGKRRRILLFRQHQQPHTGPERYATHATEYDERML
jgi:hypothetical protein